MKAAKRMLSVLLAFVMLVALLSSVAYALSRIAFMTVIRLTILRPALIPPSMMELVRI